MVSRSTRPGQATGCPAPAAHSVGNVAGAHPSPRAAASPRAPCHDGGGPARGIGHTPRRGHAGEGSRALIPQTKGRSQSAPGPRVGSEATDSAWRVSGDACEAGFSHRGQLDFQWWTTGPNVRFPPVSGRDSRVGVRSAVSHQRTLLVATTMFQQEHPIHQVGSPIVLFFSYSLL